MSDNVVHFTGITKNDFEPDYVLGRAIGQLERVVVVGESVEGQFYFAASKADAGPVVWDLQRAIHKLMMIVDELERKAE